MEQIWKDIDSTYQISSAGQVRDKTGKIRNQYDNGGGYYMVNLKDENGNWVMKYVHILVATAFKPNPYNLPEVNHIDEDKTNNCADNLEWCSRQYNNSYGTTIERGLQTKKERKSSNAEKAVACYKNGKLVNTYKSIQEAARQLNTNAGNICSCIKGDRHTCCGFTWEAVETA